MSQVHPLAGTTPRTRTEIHTSPLLINALAARYDISVATARKWKHREDSQDRSHCPHVLNTTLEPIEEALLVALRRTFLLSLDDLLAITHGYINPKASRAGLDRCLRRHGVSNLKALQPKVEGEDARRKPSKTMRPALDALHNSLQPVIARTRAVHCVVFLANSGAIGKKRRLAAHPDPHATVPPELCRASLTHPIRRVDPQSLRPARFGIIGRGRTFLCDCRAKERAASAGAAFAVGAALNRAAVSNLKRSARCYYFSSYLCPFCMGVRLLLSMNREYRCRHRLWRGISMPAPHLRRGTHCFTPQVSSSLPLALISKPCTFRLT